MANILTRWAEYNAGTLTPPALVQVDQPYPNEYLIWMTTVDGIRGPFRMTTYSAVDTLAELVAILAAEEEAANSEEVLQDEV